LRIGEEEEGRENRGWGQDIEIQDDFLDGVVKKDSSRFWGKRKLMKSKKGEQALDTYLSS